MAKQVSVEKIQKSPRLKEIAQLLVFTCGSAKKIESDIDMLYLGIRQHDVLAGAVDDETRTAVFGHKDTADYYLALLIKAPDRYLKVLDWILEHPDSKIFYEMYTFDKKKKIMPAQNIFIEWGYKASGGLKENDGFTGIIDSTGKYIDCKKIKFKDIVSKAAVISICGKTPFVRLVAESIPGDGLFEVDMSLQKKIKSGADIIQRFQKRIDELQLRLNVETANASRDSRPLLFIYKDNPDTIKKLKKFYIDSSAEKLDKFVYAYMDLDEGEKKGKNESKYYLIAYKDFVFYEKTDPPQGYEQAFHLDEKWDQKHLYNIFIPAGFELLPTPVNDEVAEKIKDALLINSGQKIKPVYERYKRDIFMIVENKTILKVHKYFIPNAEFTGMENMCKDLNTSFINSEAISQTGKILAKFYKEQKKMMTDINVVKETLENGINVTLNKLWENKNAELRVLLEEINRTVARQKDLNSLLDAGRQDWVEFLKKVIVIDAEVRKEKKYAETEAINRLKRIISESADDERTLTDRLENVFEEIKREAVRMSVEPKTKIITYLKGIIERLEKGEDN